MRAGRTDNTSRTEHGVGTTRAPRLRMARVTLAAAATLAVVVVSGPATASTLNGIATIAVPGTTTALLSGASTDQFTLSLPPQAACDGDSVHGYHVWSYLVPQGTDLSTVTFTNNQPSVGVGLLNTAGRYYGPVDSAITTGQVYGIPNNFEWAPLVTVPRISLSGLLYSGSSGVWEAGLACATSAGAVADNWNTEVTFTASSTDTNGFTWSAVPGPSGSAPASFTSAPSTTFTVGSAGTFTPTTSGSPAPTVTESGALPAGVNYSAGVLSGTPTQDGSFPVTFTATNGIESPATQSFTLIVDQAPVITSAATDTVGLGGPITPFTVTATGYPAPTFGSSGDLDGLSLDPIAGVLSGTPTVSGTFPITLTATNGVSPDAGQSFTLTVTAAPLFTTGTSATFSEGTSGSFTVVADGVPTPTLSESGTLPTGLTFDPGTGLLAGTPTQDGTFAITFSATNGVSPDASQPFTLTVHQPPAITSAATVTFVKGTPGTFDVTATGYPAPTFYVTTRIWPNWLHLDHITGVLSGTPSNITTVTFTLHATNGVRPGASQSFTVKSVPLEITTVTLPPATRGTPYSATLAELGGTGPYAWALVAGRIPDGLTLSAAGRLSGTPRPGDTAGTRHLTVGVTDHLHETATAVLSLVLH